MRIAVVVPLYKKTLSGAEVSALRQSFQIFSERQIFMICPEKLDLEYYYNLTWLKLRASKGNLFIQFPSSYFVSVKSYSRLLLTTCFYKRFIDFDYILIYQLDCWVFRDELDYWAHLGYDFIGAPWFDQSKMTRVGNGGFSLRKVKSHLRVLRSFSYISKPIDLWAAFLKEPSLRSCISFLLNLTTRNNTHHLFNNYPWNEDGFWAIVVENNFKWFRIPSSEEAVWFSFEQNPRLLYEMTGNRLPFGCHQWELNDPEFWIDHISFLKQDPTG